MSVKSLRAEVSSEAGSKGEDGRSVIDYQAPDRIRSLNQSSIGTTETLAIGATTYVSVLDKPGYFSQLPASSETGAAEAFLVVLKVVRDATEVERSGDEFRFTLSSGALGEKTVDGEATVVEGRVTVLMVRYQHNGQQVSARYGFSMFDSAPPVEPPSSDRVVPDAPVLQPCGPDGAPSPGAIICGDTGRP